MLKTIVSSLIVALVTGLTGLAYVRPDAYRAVSHYVALIFGAGMLLFWFWSWGAEFQTNYRSPNVSNPMLAAVKAAGLYLALLVYLAFLYNLPSILSQAK